MSVQQDAEKPMKREHDSMDDFEHLEDELQMEQDSKAAVSEIKEKLVEPGDLVQTDFQPERDAMTQPSQEGTNYEKEDPKTASILFLESESNRRQVDNLPSVDPFEKGSSLPDKDTSSQSQDHQRHLEDLNIHDDRSLTPEQGTREFPEEQDLIQLSMNEDVPKTEVPLKPEVPVKFEEKVKETELSKPVEQKEIPHQIADIRSSVLPVPEAAPAIDFLEDISKPKTDESAWCVVGKKEDDALAECLQPNKETDSKSDKYEAANDNAFGESPRKGQLSTTDTGESEFESEPEPSPVKHIKPTQKFDTKKTERIEEIEIAPKEIFKSIGIVAALIYWRDPKKSGIVFGAILGVLLSLAYFSLISVLAYLSLTVLIGTVSFRIYKTVLQAIQKTSDGHPFKDILEVDLTVPAEKVHEVADVAVAHANAAVSELRRLFLVEDFVDSVKFGVLLWCLTYVGSWFNGMTLIIMGVVALFTLPKVYETNKAQVDQNLALVHGKINELTAKVKAAIPLGKKPEPTKEE